MDAIEDLLKNNNTISKASEKIIVIIPFHRPLRRKEEENQHYLNGPHLHEGSELPEGRAGSCLQSFPTTCQAFSNAPHTPGLEQ